MKEAYAVLVYEDIETSMKTVVSNYVGSPFVESKRQEIARLGSDERYRLVTYIATSDTREYHQALVNAYTSELVSYCSHYENYFRTHDFTTESTRLDALAECRAYERHLIRKVALSVEVCLHEHIKVKSELALACYDYRQREERERRK